jgi:hypothetical protein
MAVAISEPTPEVITTTDTNTLATAAFTPTANTILVAAVFARLSVNLTPTMADSEGSWTREYSATYALPDALVHSLHLFWRKVGGSPVSITPTFDCTGDDFTAASISVFQITPDVVVAGNPIRQVTSNSVNTGTDPNVTFSSALQAANGYVAGIGSSLAAPGITAPSGWTETGEVSVASPNHTAWGGYRAGGETGTTITATAASSIWGMVAAEILNDEPAIKIAAISSGYHLQGLR